MTWFLKLLERLGRKRIIYDRETNEPYLERYYLLFKERSWFPFNVFLHKFLKGDNSDLHDHPWNYMTFILKGGYFEWKPESDGRVLREWLAAGDFRYRKAKSLHRIELQEGITPWTLFVAFRQQRDWGFIDNGHWVQNEKYLAERKKKHNA